MKREIHFVVVIVSRKHEEENRFVATVLHRSSDKKLIVEIIYN
jgi:hypothetical protein